MRILFIGTIKFSYSILEELISNKADIVGIITKEASAFHSDYADLSILAKRHHIPVYYTKDINSNECKEWMRALNPDYIFCMGWSQILDKEVLEIPREFAIGVHPAPLPKYRGRHPLIWTIFLGFKKTAVTFFKMDEGADTGPIISQKYFRILERDTAQEVYNKMIESGRKQIRDMVRKLEKGKVKFREQKNGSYWRKRSEIDGEIDWRMNYKAIFNLIRALYPPYPCAHFAYKDQKIKVLKAKECKKYRHVRGIEPGKILEVNENSFIVKTYDSAIEIIEWSPKVKLKQGEYL